MDLAQQRQQAHAYLDQLPPAQLRAVRSLLESMIHPLGFDVRDMLAQEGKISAEQKEAVRSSVDWLHQEKGVPMEKVLADFGLSLADFERIVRAQNLSQAAGSGQ